MPIKLVTPLSEIEAYIDKAAENVRNVIIDTLCEVGSRCITEARDNGNYVDQTGNLRSSIGYVVVVDGQIVRKNVVDLVKNGTEGTKEAEAFLERLASEHSSGICLIVVAGMNYASYVEGRGYNVLTSAELLAERLVPQLLEQIGFKVSKK